MHCSNGRLPSNKIVDLLCLPSCGVAIGQLLSRVILRWTVFSVRHVFGSHEQDDCPIIHLSWVWEVRDIPAWNGVTSWLLILIQMKAFKGYRCERGRKGTKVFHANLILVFPSWPCLFLFIPDLEPKAMKTVSAKFKTYLSWATMSVWYREHLFVCMQINHVIEEHW